MVDDFASTMRIIHLADQADAAEREMDAATWKWNMLLLLNVPGVAELYDTIDVPEAFYQVLLQHYIAHLPPDFVLTNLIGIHLQGKLIVPYIDLKNAE